MTYMKKIAIMVLTLLILLNISVSAETTAQIIQYDLTYSIDIAEDITTVSVTCTMMNNGSEPKTPVLIIALYDSIRLVDVQGNNIAVSGNTSSGAQTFSMTMPTNMINQYSMKLMAWESFGTLRPLGFIERITDLEATSRVQRIFVTAAENEEFNVYMKSTDAVDENNELVHEIGYDTQKISVTDLCGMTYEKKLTATTVSQADLIIQKADLQVGEIEFKFTKPDGSNTGINNVVKFKALTALVDEEITYLFR